MTLKALQSAAVALAFVGIAAVSAAPGPAALAGLGTLMMLRGRRA